MNIVNVDMICPSCNCELEMVIADPIQTGRYVYNGLPKPVAALVEGKKIRCETCEVTWTCTVVPRDDRDEDYYTVLYEA